MKRFANVVLLVALLVLPMSASADHVGIYNDANGTSCFLANPSGLVSVYIVHIYTLGTRGSQFTFQDQSGQLFLAAVPLDGSIPVGDPSTGIQVAYSDCYVGHFAPFRLDYLITTPIVPCQNRLRILPYPGDTNVMVVDCSLLFKPATGGEFVFGPPECTGCSANPTAETTWGGVKALYK